MAGNIIPAIATTNAVIAGIVVMQAYKILNGQLAQTKRVSGRTEMSNFHSEKKKKKTVRLLIIMGVLDVSQASDSASRITCT